MTREDLFTPVHKGIRTMIYETGKNLQVTDFTDKKATEDVCNRMKYDFSKATSACVFCLLHEHARDEADYIFQDVRSHEPEMVDMLLEEHRAIEKQLMGISEISDKLNKLENPDRRVEVGDNLSHAVNDFFAYYLAHMNKEEVTILPATQKYFTDDQLAKMRAKIIRARPTEQVMEWLKWMLPSFNIVELTDFIGEMKKTTPPPVFENLAYSMEQILGPIKWEHVRSRLGS